MTKGQHRAAVVSCFIIAAALHFLFCRWSNDMLLRQDMAPLVRIHWGGFDYTTLYAADFTMPTMGAVLGVVAPLVLVAFGVFLALGDSKKPTTPPPAGPTPVKP